MSNEMKFLRLLIGETSYRDFNTLYQMLKLTARDRSVQRESVWRNESGNKQGEYLSNVAIGYGKTAILHIIDIEANVEYLKGICNSAREQRYIDRLEEFLNKGHKWSHVDGGNRADAIIDWYDNKVYLIAAIYPLYEQDEFGKKVMVGNNVSHANNKTKRKFYPNLQTKKFFVPETGETVILKVSTNAIRTINKKGIAAVLAEAKANGNILV